MFLQGTYTLLLYMLHSWVRVLRWLLPANLKLFILVTIRTIWMTYVATVKLWWPLIGFNAVLLGYMIYNGPSIETLTVWTLGTLTLLFLYYVCCRPSVDRKTYLYAIGYIAHFLWFVPFVVLMMFTDDIYQFISMNINSAYPVTFLYNIPRAVLYALSVVLKLPLLLVKPVLSFTQLGSSKPLFLVLFLYPFTTFFLMFFLDGRATLIGLLKSIYRACLMQIFTLPVSVPFSLFVFGLYYAVHFYVLPQALNLICVGCSAGVISGIIAILSLLVMPIFISIYANVYSKHVHDEFSLYCRRQC